MEGAWWEAGAHQDLIKLGGHYASPIKRAEPPACFTKVG
jgi:hypothetical protein